MKSIFAKQTAKSNYQTLKDSKDAVHMLLHTEGLKLEPPLRKALEYLWNCTGGITKASYESISAYMTKKMGKGYGLRTIKDGFKMGKEEGLIIVEEDSDRGKKGYKLCALKILAPIEVINKYIQENATLTPEKQQEIDENMLFTRSTENPQKTGENVTKTRSAEDSFAPEIAPKFAPEFALEVAPREIVQTPCGSKDESPKIETDKSLLSSIKHNKPLKDKEKIYKKEKMDEINFARFISEWKKFKKYWNSPEEEKKAISAIKRGIKKSDVEMDFAKMEWHLQRIIGTTISNYRKGKFNDEKHFLNSLAFNIQKELNPNSISKPVQAKKPIRTELHQKWEDEFLEERAEADRKRAEATAKENEGKTVEDKKAELESILAEFRKEPVQAEPKPEETPVFNADAKPVEEPNEMQKQINALKRKIEMYQILNKPTKALENELIILSSPQSEGQSAQFV